MSHRVNMQKVSKLAEVAPIAKHYFLYGILKTNYNQNNEIHISI